MTTQPAPARLFVLLARQAPIGVILRRGPSDWVQMIKWHTDTDTFEAGQWIKARVYENKCDLSPDGKLFIYFVHKGGSYRPDPEFSRHTWTAISKPPYFTALTLWKEFGTWGGGGHFLDNKTVSINVPNSYRHPDRPTVGLTVLDSDSKLTTKQERLENDTYGQWQLVQQGKDVREDYQTLLGGLNEGTHQNQLDVDGDWYQLLAEEYETQGGNVWYTKLNPPTISQKQYANHRIEKHHYGYRWRDGEINKMFVVNNQTGERHSITDATWADFDRQGRLVLAKEGKLFAGTFDNGELQLTELADFNANKPDPQPAPEWAQKW